MTAASTDPHAHPSAHPANALPPGTRLGEIEVLDILGVGGFGIVYLALDHALEREVAVKEYMPAMLAGRTETLHVSLRSQSDAETFALGLRSFVNEAKLLARFDHPSLLKVYRFWQANDTAYMVMPVYRGQTLKAVRAAMQGPPDEAWLRSLLTPLLGAIETLHGEGVYHRDIAPDNILIEPDGRPVLLDFGAARRVLGDRSQALTAILKPAYAPIEQYAEASAVRQGPWTDLYALGATLHFALLGQAPAPSTARTLHDDMLPLAQRPLPGCSPVFLQAIDWMLAPRPGDRPQSVAALRAVLAGEDLPPAPATSAAPTSAGPGSWDRTQVRPALPASEDTLAYSALATTRLDPPADRAAPPETDLPLDLPPAPPATATPDAWRGERTARRLGPAIAGLLVAVAAGAWWWWPAAPVVVPAEAGLPSTVAAEGVDSAPASLPEPPAAETRADVQPTAAVAAAKPAATARDPANSPPSAPTANSTTAPPVSRPPTIEVPPARPATPQPRVVTPPVQQAAPPLARVPDPAPTMAAPVQAAPPPTVTSRPAPPTATAPTPAVAKPALSDQPEAICGRRVLLAQFICMEKACRTDEFENHPACRKWWHQNRPTQP